MARVVGAYRRVKLSVFDTYLVDGDFVDEVPAGIDGEFSFFKHAPLSVRRTNAIEAGVVPENERWQITNIALGLTFSRAELYTVAFRCLTFKPVFSGLSLSPIHTEQFLQASLEMPVLPDADFGFYQSLPLGRDLVLGAKSQYQVKAGVHDPLLRELTKLERCAERKDYVAIRVYLEGLKTVRME